MPVRDLVAHLNRSVHGLHHHSLLRGWHGTRLRLLHSLQYSIANAVMVTTLVAIGGYMMGSLVGIVFSTSEHAIQILPLIIIPLVLFGGLIVNLKTIPEYSSWAQYISPIRHTYSSLILDQLSSNRMHNIIQFDEVKEFMGVNGEYWMNVLYLFLITAGCSILSLVAMYLKRKPI